MEDTEGYKNNIVNDKSCFFVNILTNERGQRFNLFVFQYFKKYEIGDFQKIFNVDTVKEYLKLKSFVGESESDEKNGKYMDTSSN